VPLAAGRAGRAARCLLAALAAAVALTAPAAAAAADAPPGAGGVGVRLLDAPESARDDPRARVYIVDHLPPGTTIRRRIEVGNSSPAPVGVTLYAAAAAIEHGAFVGADGHTANDVSTWTSVDPTAVEIPAGGTTTATVTIAVPADAAPGEQYGAVWAETRGPAPAAGGVTQVGRVGIRMYLDVGPGGAGAPDFTVDSLTARRMPDGRPSIAASVHNTGGRALDMSGTLALAGGPGGLSAGPYPATLGVTLAVGATEAVTVELDRQLPAGPWDAQVTLKSGLVERGARAALTFPDRGDGPAVATTPDSLLPYAVGAFGVVGLAAFAARTVVLHRRRGVIRPESPVRL
jgi:hypothetical protein